MFPPMSTDGRARARPSSRSTATSTRASSPSRWPTARAAYGAEIEHAHARHRRSSCAAAALHEVVTDKGTIEHRRRRRTPAACTRPRSARLVGVERPDHPDGAPVPGHRAVRSAARAAADAARPRQPHLLPHRGGRARDGRLRAQPGAVGARRHARRASRPSSCPRTGTASSSCSRARSSACRRWRAPRCKKFFNGPEAFTPDGEFILGESDVPGFWVAAGFCAHGLAGAGGIGKVMAEWIVDGEPESRPLAHGHAAASAASTARRATRSRARPRCYSTYYDIKYPGQERTAGRPLRLSPAYARLRRARRELRREVGLGAGQLVRAERRRLATRRCGRAAGRARTGRRRSTPRRSPRASGRRSSTSRRSPRSRSRPRRAPPTCSGCARTTSTAPVGTVTYTQMLNSRGGHRGRLSRVTRLGERPLPARHRHRLRRPRPRAGCARHMPARRVGRGRRRHVGATRASACGGRGRATSCSR